MSIRLNKLLARRGIGARRKCDALIKEGAVRVNGAVVTEPGTQVEPERDRIEVRGRGLPPAAELRYYVLHKPVGVISTLHDPEGRHTVRELLPPGARLFPVGRLDADTSGLLVLTNDGELAHRLMHPRYGVDKSYRVRVASPPGPEQLRRLASGVEFEPGVVSAPARVRVVDSRPGRAMLALTIHEGRYRQVRRMCEAVGLTVVSLHRSAYGPLHLGTLARGLWREISAEEVARLRAAAARPARPGGRRYLGVPRGRGERRGRPAGLTSRRPDRRERTMPGDEMRARGRGPRGGFTGARRRRGPPRAGESRPRRGGSPSGIARRRNGPSRSRRRPETR